MISPEEHKETPTTNLRLTALVALIIVAACAVAMWTRDNSPTWITSILLIVGLALLIWFVWMPISKGFLPAALLMTGALVLWVACGNSVAGDISGNMLVGFGIITLGQRLLEATEIIPPAYR